MLKGRSDFWKDYEYRDIVEIIWKNYELYIQEQENLAHEYNNSKSILSTPYKIKKLWKKIKWSFRPAQDGEETVPGSGDYTLEFISEFKKDEVLLGVSELLFSTENDYIETPFDIEVAAPSNEAKLIKKDGTILTYDDVVDYARNGSIEFWAPEYFIHNNLILELYAPMVGLDQKTIYNLDRYSELFFSMIKALWFVLVNGPTIKNIKIGLYIFFNLPISLRAGGKVTVAEPGHVKVEYETETAYVEEWFFSKNTAIECTVGDILGQYTFLVDGPKVLDYINSPNWWEKYHYYLGYNNLEKYTRMFSDIPDEAFKEDEKREMSVLANFMERIIPEYINYSLALTKKFDHEYLKEIGDNEWDELMVKIQSTLSDTFPEVGGGYKVDGTLKADNFGETLVIKKRVVSDGTETTIDRWKIY